MKKEFYANQETVRKFNLYKNLKGDLNRKIQNRKKSLFADFKTFENKRFSDFDKLKSELEKKFDEMSRIIEEYDKSIVQEATIYKDFIQETDAFLSELFRSDKVGKGLNIKDLIELVKEGEVRYRYSVPPGYGDAERKEGLDKFGDLIIWKELLEEANNMNEDTIVFVTSDTEKGDWFDINPSTPYHRPRKELISEFKYCHPQKDIIIVSFNDFIELILEDSNPSDKEVLIELQANRFIHRIKGTSAFYKMIEKNIQAIEVDNFKTELITLIDHPMKEFIASIYKIEDQTLKLTDVEQSISIKEDKVFYLIDLSVEFEWEVVSDRGEILSYGSIFGVMKMDIVLERYLEEGEGEFLKRLNEDEEEILTLNGINFENPYYIWGSDEDLYIPEREEQFYTTCPKCGEGINFYNDGKNGFCTSCS